MQLSPFKLLLVFCGCALGMVALRDGVTQRTAAADSTATAPPQPTIEPSRKPLVDPAIQGRTAYLRKEDDNGHYWANAKINGAFIRMMVDSGASVIALTPRDAQKLHIDTSRLNYDRELSTANGRVRAATVILDEIVIERVRVTDVQAVVLSGGLETSLLGMSFLNRLTEWKATPRAILIRQ